MQEKNSYKKILQKKIKISKFINLISKLNLHDFQSNMQNMWDFFFS